VTTRRNSPGPHDASPPPRSYALGPVRRRPPPRHGPVTTSSAHVQDRSGADRRRQGTIWSGEVRVRDPVPDDRRGGLHRGGLLWPVRVQRTQATHTAGLSVSSLRWRIPPTGTPRFPGGLPAVPHARVERLGASDRRRGSSCQIATIMGRPAVAVAPGTAGVTRPPRQDLAVPDLAVPIARSSRARTRARRPPSCWRRHRSPDP